MKEHKPMLNRILKKAVISPMLRKAVEAIIKALTDKDFVLAYKLSACKSYITGEIDLKDKVNAFQEDNDKNEKIFTRPVYSILDGIHHDIAAAIDAIPSGMMIVGRGEVKEMKIESGLHPVLKRIKFENGAIHKRFPN